MIITRDEVKRYLNILDTSQDAVIDIMLPVVDSSVKEYTNNNYKTRFVGTVTTGSNSVFIKPAIYAEVGESSFTTNYYKYPGYILSDWLVTGQKIYSTGVSEGVYITDIDDDNSIITLSANATQDYSGLMYGGATLGECFIFAKMVQDLIDQNNTSVEAGGIKSRTEGPTSVTYTDSSSEKINGISKGLFAGLKQYI